MRTLVSNDAQGRSARRAGRDHAWTLLVLAATCAAATPPATAAPTVAERLHLRAVEVFRQGRFPEAYGRFVGLANAGHPASARYALWMCQQGLALFGRDWDCAPHEVEDWARAAGVDAPSIAPRVSVSTVGPVRAGREGGRVAGRERGRD